MKDKGTKPVIPGLNSFRTFTMECNDCQKEFTLNGTYEDADHAVCPLCSGKNIKELYITFPTDGPGFQKDYDAANFMGSEQGGCSGPNGCGTPAPVTDDCSGCSADDCSSCSSKH